MLLPWVLCSILSFIVLILCVKIHTLKVGMTEIRVQLADWLKTDTNTLISISSSDRQMRLLASDLNRQLRLLRRQRRWYLDGDRELKDAVTNIFHDLRTPLTAICGYLDLLRNEEKSEKVTHYVMAIQNRAEVLKQLTEELFRYSIIMSAQEPMQLEPLCVNDMLEQSIVSFYATLTKRGITPQIDITEKRIMRTILGTLADWGIGERGETSKTWKFDFGEFYELTLDFYHWLRRCIEGYMERNRPSWYCKARFQWIVQSQVIVLKPKKEMRDINMQYHIMIKNLSKSYQSKGTAKTALSDVTLNIPQGEIFCIMGSSGSGKSTLLKILGGMEKPTSGTVYINGANMADYGQQDYDRHRQMTVGYVFQDFNLLEGLTLKENIILPLTLQKLSETEIQKKYADTLRCVDVGYCENNYPEQSSGGEQQRAAICRAIIKSPKLILADEPTGSLDHVNAKAILSTFMDIKERMQTTIVLVTHDAAVASYCDTVVFIENGRVCDTLRKEGAAQPFYERIVTVSSKVRGVI